MLLTIDFVGVERLPDARLDPDAGPVTAALAEEGLGDLQAAARWLQALPYGPNDALDTLACVRERQGTCTTKHATASACATELGAPVEWILGVYALDGTVSRDVGPVLADAGLDWVPTIHCFLRSEDSYVDLTEGNCNGKDRMITEYAEVTVATEAADEARLRRRFVDRLVASDPAFVGRTADEVIDVVSRCHSAMHLACRATT